MAKRKVVGAVDRIDRRNLIYFILYNWVKTIFFQFYSRVEVHGVENIPKDAPVIFTPNHQNALMDALIVLYSSPGDTVFLARADLFRKKFMAYLLNSLKILPVFRIRDGVEELGKNQEIFDITVGVLHRNHQLCLMPEGNHGDKRRLRRIGKGVFRIAFSTQEKMGSRPYVKIVPVGLDFSDYEKVYQTLNVVYGEPIEVADYWEGYVENPARATNLLKERFTDEIKKLMIHIDTEAFYDLYIGLRTLFNDRMRELMGIEGDGLYDRFLADKEMIRRLNQRLEEVETAAGQAGQPGSDVQAGQRESDVQEGQTGSAATAGQSGSDVQEGQTGSAAQAGGQSSSQEAVPSPRLQKKVVPDDPHPLVVLREQMERYMGQLKEMNIRDWVVAEQGYSGLRTAWRWFTLVLTFPVFLYGLINNALMYFIPVKAVQGIKDRQFHSSVKAGLAMLVVVPLTYTLQTVLVAIFTGPWYWWVAYLVTLYPTGKLALLWYLRLKKTRRGGWFGRQCRKGAKPAVDITNLRKFIIAGTEKLM